MGCNCGKNKTKREQTFQVKTPDGRTSTHDTKRAAELEAQRRGGTITRKA